MIYPTVKCAQLSHHFTDGVVILSNVYIESFSTYHKYSHALTLFPYSFQVIGCVVLGLGIYALVDGASLVSLVDQSGVGGDVNITAFTSAAYIFIVVAVFVVILTFFGCCGAIKESKCMLGTYFTLILVMFVVMIAGAVLGYSTSMDKLQDALEKTMPQYQDNIDNAKNDSQKAITEAWNEVQTSVSDFLILQMYLT